MNDSQHLPKTAIPLKASALETAIQLTKLDDQDVLSLEDLHTTLLIALHSLSIHLEAVENKKPQYPIEFVTQDVENNTKGKLFMSKQIAERMDFFEIIIIQDVPVIAVSIDGAILPSYFAYSEETIHTLSLIIQECQNL